MGRLEGIAENTEKQLSDLHEKTDEIHAVVTNGLKDQVKRLSEAIESKPEVVTTTKKPRRIEVLTTIVVVLTILNFLGLLEPIGDAFRHWVRGPETQIEVNVTSDDTGTD